MSREAEAAPQISATIASLSDTVSSILSTGQSPTVEQADIQALMIAAVRLYVARRESGAEFLPFNEDDLTATEVLISAAAMLKAARLEVFELTMWKGFGTV